MRDIGLLYPVFNITNKRDICDFLILCAIFSYYEFYLDFI